MRNKLYAVLLMVAIALPASSQVITRTSKRIWKQSSAPASCNAGDVYFNTGDNTLYVCGPADTWASAGGGSGASTALDNLASVAINTSLISDTTNTDDIGASGTTWRSGYFGTDVISAGYGIATGNISFQDAEDADPTKKLAFDLTGITTATTRTVTWPDADVTIGNFLDGTDDTITSVTGTPLTVNTTGASANPVIYGNASATHTGDLFKLAVNSVEKFAVGLAGDVVVGAGTSSVPSLRFGSQTNTGFIYKDANSVTWVSNGIDRAYFGSTGILIGSTYQYYWGASGITGNDTGLERVSAGMVGVTNGSTGDGSLYVGISQQGGGSKALTDAVATGFVKVSAASGSVTGVRIRYTIKATDATDYQGTTGTLHFTAINKAGTITFSTPAQTEDTPLVTTGTLAATAFTFTDNADNTFTVNANSDTSLTTSTFTIDYFPEINGTATVTQL